MGGNQVFDGETHENAEISLRWSMHESKRPFVARTERAMSIAAQAQELEIVPNIPAGFLPWSSAELS